MAFWAQIGILIILCAFLIYHFLILLRVIDYTSVWGGKLKTVKDMHRFETISVIFIVLIIVMILAKLNFIKLALPAVIARAFYGILSVLFALNTLGNIMSENKLEKFLFTPLTILLCILSLYSVFNV